MASKGNTLESWEPSPWTPAPNANVADQKAMTSLQAQAARAKSAEVMAALKKGEPGDADRLLGPSRQQNDSLIPGMGRLKDRILNGKTKKKEGKEEKIIR